VVSLLRVEMLLFAQLELEAAAVKKVEVTRKYLEAELGLVDGRPGLELVGPKRVPYHYSSASAFQPITFAGSVEFAVAAALS